VEATCDVIPVDKLKVEMKHPILRAERDCTIYGPSVVRTLQGSESWRYKVYVPKCYCGLITVDDIAAINDRYIVPHLIYKGTRRFTSQHLLSILRDDSA
jgi:hypothetical protein